MNRRFKSFHANNNPDNRLREVHKVKFGFYPNEAKLAAFKQKREKDDNRQREYWRQFAIEDALRLSNKAKGGN